MNRLYCLIVVFFTCGVCEAQNLVPNGDFEQYIGCPNYAGEIDSALFWFNPAIFPGGGGSPDYFNQCGSPGVKVPKNILGFQYANSGVAYSGIYLYEINFVDTIGYREYIEVPLIVGLSPNNCYHLEMYINLANRSTYITNTIEAYFSDTLVSGITNFNPLPFVPQIGMNIISFTDTVNWHLISGDYLAHGGESYLIIGNFKNDASTPTFTVNNNINACNCVYFYIDDVSLTQVPCNTGMNLIEKHNLVNVSPNPFFENLKLKTNNIEPKEIILYDIASRKLLQQKFTNSITLNTEQLAKGIYLYEVRNKNGVVKKGKIVKD